MDQSGSTGGQGAPTGPTSGWSAPPPPPANPGPAGLVYGDFTTRVIALIIDGIILAIADQIVFLILSAVGLRLYDLSTLGFNLGYNPIVGIIYAVISLAISGGYFVYMWTKRRATFGMQVMKLQVGDAGTGATMTQDQAIKRWAALYGPSALTFGIYAFPLIGTLIAIASLGWVIYLAYTTNQSPTKQGWHDVFAHTQVVKSAV
jgi:uncharacterized RDD family membrane protein YckC